MSNVKNYFDQPDADGDNPLHITGSIYITGTQFIDDSITITTGNSIDMETGSAINIESGASIEIASTADINVANGGDINVASGGEITVASGGALTVAGTLFIDGTTYLDGLAFADQKLKNAIRSSTEYLEVNTNTILNIYGWNVITGGTGLSGVTLPAPEPGVTCIINIASISSGSVIVTTDSGVTYDGTNNTATFNAANDQLVLKYKSATEWKVVYNNSVTLSAV